jgi:uncharacterized protein YkwD
MWRRRSSQVRWLRSGCDPVDTARVNLVAGTTRRVVVVVAVALCLLTVTTTAASADAGVEAEFVQLTNNARGGRNLTVDSQLTAVARRWSAKMAADNRLAHNPNLAKEVTHDWAKLGENVGTGDNAPQIHDAFMNSPAHRANILDSDFTHVGIGVVRGGDGRIWVTEVFMKLRSGGGSAPPPTSPPPTAAPTTTARPRVTTPPPTAPPPTAPPTTAAPTTTSTTTTTTTTTIPLPPPPPSSSSELTPRYVLVLEGLARLDPGS